MVLGEAGTESVVEELDVKHQAAPHVPRRFWEAVCAHLALNLGGDTDAPLVLGVHGPPGSGKTFQLFQVFADLGVESVLISGGQLEDSSAGEPAKLIRRSYLQVSDLVKQGQPAALVFNDLDTGLGEWETNSGTVNHQTVLGEMMHLVDSPEAVGGHSARRSPVFATGNDFTKLYGPLRRTGRMQLLHWEPTSAERLDIVRRILAEFDEAFIRRIVEEFAGQPISFFSHLRAAVRREEVLATIDGSEREWIAHLASGGDLPAFETVDTDVLLEAARQLAASTNIESHV